MLRGCFLLLVLGLSATQVAGQVNLVPNGSFEEYTECPINDGIIGNVHKAIGWYSPTGGTSDFFHECAYEIGWGIPTVEGYYAFADSGMARIIMFGLVGDQTREYISCELSDTLEAGELYQFTMHLKYANGNGRVIGSVSAHFSPDSIMDTTLNHELLDLLPTIQRDPDSIMSDTSIWYKWQATFNAQGGERFVTIGNLLDDVDTEWEALSINQTSCAYYLDGISLIKYEPDAIQEFTIEASFSPNPATDQLTITSNHPQLHVSILSIAGQVLQTEQLIGSGNHQLDLNGLSSGVYFVRMQTSDGGRVEKLVIQ